MAVANQIRKDPSKIGTSNYILDSLNLVLHNMYIEFNGDFYLQTSGTAMDTSLASNYANLFMDKFKTKDFANYPLKPFIWKRFVDDIFMVWTHGIDQLNKFVDYINDIHPTIKYTDEYSQSEVNFLDTTVKIQTKMPVYHLIQQTNRHSSLATLHFCTPT